MEAIELQLDLFSNNEEQTLFKGEEVNELHFPLKTKAHELSLSTSKEADLVLFPFEVGDNVTLSIPEEEHDSELYIWLTSYYPHLKGKNGRITEVLPYKKLQYGIQFDVKHEDNSIIMYHKYLKWID